MAKKIPPWAIIIFIGAVAWWSLTILNGLSDEMEEREYSNETKEVLEEGIEGVEVARDEFTDAVEFSKQVPKQDS